MRTCIVLSNSRNRIRIETGNNRATDRHLKVLVRRLNECVDTTIVAFCLSNQISYRIHQNEPVRLDDSILSTEYHMHYSLNDRHQIDDIVEKRL